MGRRLTVVDVGRVRGVRRRRGDSRTHRGEDGSAVIETVVGVPAFLLFVGLILFAARMALAHQAVESAAVDEVRAASIARTEFEAQSTAHESAVQSLRDQGLHCLTVQVSLDLTAFNTAPGEAASLGATVRCRVDLSPVGIPGVADSKVVTATMTSPLDTFRTRS